MRAIPLSMGIQCKAQFGPCPMCVRQVLSREGQSLETWCGEGSTAKPLRQPAIFVGDKWRA